ncbi:MAG: hypothetical protein AB8E82_12820 [Aureispira sp.]
MPLLPSVSQESIRLWAYDLECYFQSTNDGEILQALEWLPLLLELAADANCPKQQQIEHIIEAFVQNAFLKKEAATLEGIQAILSQQQALLKSQWLILMMVSFNYIYSILKQPQRITEAACDKIAKELLQGSNNNKSFVKEEPLQDGTAVYATALEKLKQYLYISPETGLWKTSKYLRWKTFLDDTKS